MKKYHWFVVGLVLVLGIVGYLKSLYKWEPLRENKACARLFHSQIVSISLYQNATYPEWAVFDDEDLILLWVEYFEDMDIRRCSIFRMTDNIKTDGGGASIITITTDDGEYSFGFYSKQDKCRLELGGYEYETTNVLDNPFDETYAESVKRHGTVTPWE